MCAVTPRGSFEVKSNLFPGTGMVLPCILSARPAKYSKWRADWATSPFACPRGLPLFRVSSLANSESRSLSVLAILKSILPLLLGSMLLQAGSSKVLLAASTAALTSSASPFGTRARVLPLAGFRTA